MARDSAGLGQSPTETGAPLRAQAGSSAVSGGDRSALGAGGHVAIEEGLVGRVRAGFRRAEAGQFAPNSSRDWSYKPKQSIPQERVLGRRGLESNW